MFDLIFVFERIEFEIGVTSRLKNSFILRTFNDSSVKMKIFSTSNTPDRKKDKLHDARVRELAFLVSKSMQMHVIFLSTLARGQAFTTFLSVHDLREIS